eukprot:TRINITY_DN4513_c0_g1_i1.p1 TRINITY_DN4513_c0_g1~~TRINITY_DN4513_c0_g1_i1.p1  ORF type:complete len:452 (+),score=107.46 TRINITY_DN4513_c0_g1_i1:92-1447(+)
MIRRPPRSTLSSSSAASDVYKRQVLPVIDPARNSAVEMSIANLMMKYRDVMRAPGKTKTEKERDFVLLMRDKFLGMADDIVLVEKHVNLLRGCYPKKGKFKKKDTIENLDEPGDIMKAYPDFNIMLPSKKVPPISERMMLVMWEIPDFTLRCDCCESMMFLSDKLNEKVDAFVSSINLYTDSAQLALKSKSLTNILRGTCCLANFVNHQVLIAGRMNMVEKQKCKPAVGFDLFDCYTNMTNYYTCKEWEDNFKKNSVLYFVISMLADEKADKGIEIEELQKLADVTKRAMKSKMWDLESKTDEIEAHVNILARAIGQLQDFEDQYEDVDGVQTLISAPKRVRAASIQGVSDKFQIGVQEFLKNIGHIVPKITDARRKMYQANLMLLNHVMKADTSKNYEKGYLALPEDNFKMPAAERFVRMVSVLVEAAIDTYQNTQKNSVLGKGVQAAGL